MLEDIEEKVRENFAKAFEQSLEKIFQAKRMKKSKYLKLYYCTFKTQTLIKER